MISFLAGPRATSWLRVVHVVAVVLVVEVMDARVWRMIFVVCCVLLLLLLPPPPPPACVEE